MSRSEILSASESFIRNLLFFLPPYISAAIFTYGRKAFIRTLCDDLPKNIFSPPESLHRKFWDIDFGSSLFNAAGMFKNADGYVVAQRQGAGAFLAGSTTCIPRKGNVKNGLVHPFMPYPKTGIATNWIGLPNKGHEEVAKKISRIEKAAFCPVGVSISPDPEVDESASLNGVVQGLELFVRTNADFIELNESCPNVPHENSFVSANNFILEDSLYRRLEYISRKFLKKRKRNLPVIVKFSNDTEFVSVGALVDVLVELQFDGINFGNTSTAYNEFIPQIAPSELNHFKYFTENYGGGVSGRLLKDKSFQLASKAAAHLKTLNLSREFHVIRTGGIESAADVAISIFDGISLCQWFTGYFAKFARHGHKIYKNIYEESV